MATSSSDPRWFRTDTEIEAVSSLEFVLAQLVGVTQDDQAWRWVIIGLDRCLQSFLIASFGTAPAFLALRKEDSDHLYRAIRGEVPYRDKYYLQNLESLYKTAKRVHGWPVNDQIDRNIARLQELRNNFLHRHPGSWSVEVSLLVAVTASALSVIEYVGWRSNCFPWYHFRDGSSIVAAETLRLARETLRGFEKALNQRTQEEP